MQRIRFTYKNSAVVPSVFLLLYFRMFGIYVYERFLDSDRERIEQLLKYLPEGEGISRPERYDDYDLDLYYIADQEDYQAYCERYGNEQGEKKLAKLLIFSDSMKVERLRQKGVRTLQYLQGNDLQLLQDIINAMDSLEVIPGYTKEELLLGADIYYGNQVWNTSLLGKYFYVAEGEKQYKNIVKQYYEIIEDIFSILQKKECSWGDKKFIHLQYAALNMSYEGNEYCVRNKKSQIYRPQGLVRICRKLLEGEIGKEKLGESFYLLLAQILDDLLDDHNAAYENYLYACKDYNAYAYYRKGIYWQEVAQRYDNAIKYYTKSVYIYPEYYRAWFRLGRCYMLVNKCREALEMFRNVSRILRPRLEAKTVRPMEIEYMFKAQNQCGYICNKVLNNPQQSIRENIEAERAWNMIDDSEFFELFGNEKSKIARKRVKEELNVSRIYMEICKLADKIGDTQLKKNYLCKLFNLL